MAVAASSSNEHFRITSPLKSYAKLDRGVVRPPKSGIELIKRILSFSAGRCLKSTADVARTRREGSRLSPSCRSYCRSLGDIHCAKPKSVCDRMAHRSFAVQNHVQITAIDAMVLRKGGLTSLALN